jgi:hypothetical protein
MQERFGVWLLKEKLEEMDEALFQQKPGRLRGVKISYQSVPQKTQDVGERRVEEVREEEAESPAAKRVVVETTNAHTQLT